MLKMQKTNKNHKKPKKNQTCDKKPNLTEICFLAQSVTCLSNDSLSGFNSEYSNIVVSVQYFVLSAFWILRDKFCYILKVSILTI